MSDEIEARLEALGIELPEPMTPLGTYVGVVVAGGLAFVSGHGPVAPGGDRPRYTGKLTSARTIEEGYRAARLCALNCLGSARAALGGLDRIRRVVKLLGFIQSDLDFHDQPKVLNGASDVLVEIFGAERGSHARSAVGMAALPRDITVEVEMILELERDR